MTDTQTTEPVEEEPTPPPLPERPATPPSVTQALATLSWELGPIAKGDTMGGPGGGYQYRGIDALLRKASPLMAAHGITFLPRVVERIVEPVSVGRDKTWRLVTLIVAYRVTGPAGDSIEVTTCGEGMDGGDKAANKAMTSAFKQALVQSLAIADGHDDPDHTQTPADAGVTQATAAPPARRPAQPVTPEGDRTSEETAIRAIIGNLPDEPARALRTEFTEHFGSGLATLDAERHADALTWVEAWVAHNIADSEPETGEPTP